MLDHSLIEASMSEQSRAQIRNMPLTEKEYHANLREIEKQGWERGWKEGWVKGWQDGQEENIKAMVIPLLESDTPKNTVVSQLQTQFNLEKDQAIMQYEKYANNPPFCTTIRNW